mmetsp:Transcript_11300/g.30891  ORF Transcript_11300/g.30891 Transcript_11300/m.30891 type:complete len:364 (-) Transcript_11300:1513-2604(-)
MRGGRRGLSRLRGANRRRRCDRRDLVLHFLDKRVGRRLERRRHARRERVYVVVAAGRGRRGGHHNLVRHLDAARQAAIHGHAVDPQVRDHVRVHAGDRRGDRRLERVHEHGVLERVRRDARDCARDLDGDDRRRRRRRRRLGRRHVVGERVAVRRERRVHLEQADGPHRVLVRDALRRLRGDGPEGPRAGRGVDLGVQAFLERFALVRRRDLGGGPHDQVAGKPVEGGAVRLQELSAQRVARLRERGEGLEPRRRGDVRDGLGVALAVRDDGRRLLRERDVPAGRDRPPVEAHVVIDARRAELHAVQRGRPRDAVPRVVRQRQRGGLALVRRRRRTAAREGGLVLIPHGPLRAALVDLVREEE